MRKCRAVERNIGVEHKYGSVRLHKFINMIMWEGKKSVAEDIVYSSLVSASEKLSTTVIECFEKVIEFLRPKLEVKTRRVGGANYQVPMPVRAKRADYMAMRWLINAARARSGKSMIEKLTAEIIDAYSGKGSAVKKKEECEKMAESNRAYAHYSWGVSEEEGGVNG
jgi:small subunit ribosomal protein S7